MRRRLLIAALITLSGPLAWAATAGSAPVPGTVTIAPSSGAAGTIVVASGSVTCVASTQVITLVQGTTALASQSTNDGNFSVSLTVPAGALAQTDQITSTCDGSSVVLGQFTVTAAATTTTTAPAPTTTAAPTSTTAPTPTSTTPPAPAAGAVTATPRFTG
jgi:autotransporter translocation and assembly factor TamB